MEKPIPIKLAEMEIQQGINYMHTVGPDGDLKTALSMLNMILLRSLDLYALYCQETGQKNVFRQE